MTTPTGTLTPDVPRNVILHGNALDVLRSLPDACVQTCVTSPPYFGLRSYGTSPQIWGGVSTCQHVWGEPQRTPWANEVAGPHGRQKNLEASHNRTKYTGPVCRQCGAWRGELGQETSPQAFVDHLVQIFREVGRVLRADGTLWVNLSDSIAGRSGGGDPHRVTSSGMSVPPQRRAVAVGYPPKSYLLIPERFALRMTDDGWLLRNKIIWHKPNGMCESVKDRCTNDYEVLFLFAKRARYYFNADAIAEPAKEHRGQSATFKREGSKRGVSIVPGQAHGTHRADREDVRYSGGMRNARSVWSINTEPYTEAHFATYPVELPSRCIRAGSRPGDLVIDPFFGAGTSGVAAQRLGRDYLGIELNPEYVAMANERIIRDTLPPAMKDVDLELLPPTLFDAMEVA